MWAAVSAWTSYPAAGIAHVVLGNGAKDWVHTIRKAPGRFEVDTRITVLVPGRGHGELTLEADAAQYAYGLPLYLALLLAARGDRLLRRALTGYGLLLLPQAFSLSLDVLKRIAFAAPGGPAQLGIAQWQLEVIALGYQAGTLLLPTLAPVGLWLWLDRNFLRSMIVESWLGRRLDQAGGNGPPSSS